MSSRRVVARVKIGVGISTVTALAELRAPQTRGSGTAAVSALRAGYRVAAGPW